MLNELFRNLSTNSSTKWLFTEIHIPGTSASRRAKTRAKPRVAKATATSLQFTLEGAIERGKSTPFAVNGQDFSMDNETWIFGEITLGSHAMVQGVIRAEDKKYAKKVVLKKV